MEFVVGGQGCSGAESRSHPVKVVRGREANSQARCGLGGSATLDLMSAPTYLKSQTTYDDVNLILRLYELRREEKMRDARVWFVSKFKCKTMEEFSKLCPPGSDANA